jgi:EmrB/QacA subfamily drug resistance transporter
MPEAGVALHGRRIHIVMLAMMSGLFLAALDANIVSVAMPTISGDLGGVDKITWIITAYLLTQTIATPIIGKLSDLYGRKPTFQVTIVIFLVASAVCGAAWNLPALIAFRALQGIGAGGLLALPMAIVGDIVPPAQRGRYQGYISATFALSALLGPLVGGFIVDQLDWRWVFYVNLPIGLLSMVLVQRYLVIPHRASRREIDYLGAGLLAAAVSPLLLALTWGGDEHAWGSATILGLIAFTAVALACFIAWEVRVPEPMLPLRLFRSPIVSVTCVGAFISGVGIYGGTLFVPLFLQVVRDVSATRSGLSMAPMMLAVLTASITSGRLIARTGRYKIFPLSGVFLLTIGCILLATMDVHTSYLGVALRMVVLGAGMGQIGPSLMIIIQNAVDHRDLGVATGAFNFIRTLGGAIATAVLGAVFAARLDVLIPRYVDADALSQLPDTSSLRGTPSQIQAIEDPAVHDGVVRAFADAVRSTYLVAIPVCIVAFCIFAFVREVPLRQSMTDDQDAITPLEVGT